MSRWEGCCGVKLPCDIGIFMWFRIEWGAMQLEAQNPENHRVENLEECWTWTKDLAKRGIHLWPLARSFGINTQCMVSEVFNQAPIQINEMRVNVLHIEVTFIIHIWRLSKWLIGLSELRYKS